MLRGLFSLPVARADAAAMTAVGVDLTPITAHLPPVRMRREEVDVYLFPRLAVVEARFELDNHGQALELEVGFPCLPAADPFVARAAALRSFGVRVDRRELKVVRRAHDNPEFPAWYVWTQVFAPNQRVVVEVRYWVPLEAYAGVSCAPFVYVLRTGRFWQGSIGEAIVRVHAQLVSPKAILATTPAGYAWEGETLVWRFADLDPEHDVGLLVSPLAALAARLGYRDDYVDVLRLHAQRPAAGTKVAVGGYFREHAPEVLLGERSRDLNIAIPDPLRAYSERRDAGLVGVEVRGLERATARVLSFPREDAYWSRVLILGRVAYEGERLLIEVDERLELGRGDFDIEVPRRFAWAMAEHEGPRVAEQGGEWPPFVERATVYKLEDGEPSNAG